MPQEKNILKYANADANEAYNIRRFITDLALTALGVPLIAGGIRGLSTLSRLPIVNNDQDQGVLYDIEYKLLKHNPDLFTKTQIELLGEKKKKEIIEKIKKIKEEQKDTNKGRNKENDGSEEKPEDNVESVSNFITKESSSIKFAEEEDYGSAYGLVKGITDLFIKSPIYPFALIAVPAASYIFGQSLARKANKTVTDAHTRKYMEAAKSRFYNDLLDLQLLSKKTREHSFSYENLMNLPLKSRKKLRDVLLEHTGKDYSLYLGLDMKYPELFPAKELSESDVSAVSSSRLSAAEVADAVENNEEELEDFIKNIEKGLGTDKKASASSVLSTLLGSAFLLAIAYPTLSFTAATVNSYMKSKPKDPLAALEGYLEQKREDVVIPEGGIPSRLSGLSKSISELVHPEDLLVGIMDEKSRGVVRAKTKEQLKNKNKDKSKDKEKDVSDSDKESKEKEQAVYSVPVDELVSKKLESIRYAY